MRHSRYALHAAALLALIVMLTGCAMPSRAGGGVAPSSYLSAYPPSVDNPALTGIVVTGSGTASDQPDLAYINLAIEAVHAEVDQAINENMGRMAGVMAALTEMSIEEHNLQTLNYSVWSEQVTDFEGRPTGETRYHAINELRVRLNDPAKVGDTLAAVLKGGANRVNGISFGVADPAALHRRARDLAIQDARAKADQLANGLGASVGPLRYVSESTSTPFPETGMAYGIGGGGGPTVPISAGELSVSAQILVIFETVP